MKNVDQEMPLQGRQNHPENLENLADHLHRATVTLEMNLGIEENLVIEDLPPLHRATLTFEMNPGLEKNLIIEDLPRLHLGEIPLLLSNIDHLENPIDSTE
jgi:hypothetical protein